MRGLKRVWSEILCLAQVRLWHVTRLLPSLAVGWVWLTRLGADELKFQCAVQIFLLKFCDFFSKLNNVQYFSSVGFCEVLNIGIGLTWQQVHVHSFFLLLVQFPKTACSHGIKHRILAKQRFSVIVKFVFMRHECTIHTYNPLMQTCECFCGSFNMAPTIYDFYIVTPTSEYFQKLINEFF